MVVKEIRRLSGFERVVLYRFHADGVGSVDSESKVAHLDPFLQLHYPASDILEYMGNMGVQSSMSISLIVDDRLWGLISCANHSEPRLIPYELRAACEMIGRLTSLQLAVVAENEVQIARDSRRLERAELARALRVGEVLEGALASESNLLRLVNAEGAAVMRGPDVRTTGATPSVEAIMALAERRGEESYGSGPSF
jgi:chemotaxis family two-component system sensor kinase Cph1